MFIEPSSYLYNYAVRKLMTLKYYGLYEKKNTVCRHFLVRYERLVKRGIKKISLNCLNYFRKCNFNKSLKKD